VSTRSAAAALEVTFNTITVLRASVVRV